MQNMHFAIVSTSRFGLETELFSIFNEMPFNVGTDVSSWITVFAIKMSNLEIELKNTVFIQNSNTIFPWIDGDLRPFMA